MTRTAVILLFTICASIGFGALRTNRNQPQQPVDSISQGPLKVTITTIGPALGPPTNRYKFGERMPVMIELTNTQTSLRMLVSQAICIRMFRDSRRMVR